MYVSGSYATEVSALLNTTLCNLDLGTSDTCDLDALEYATAHPDVFKLVSQMSCLVLSCLQASESSYHLIDHLIYYSTLVSLVEQTPSP